MNSNKIFEVVERVATTSSKNEKEEIIRSEVAADASGLLRRALVFATSPYMTYGIGKLEAAPKTPGEGEFTDAQTWRLLDLLAKRTLSGNAARAAVQEERARLTEASRILLDRILLKDLRAGISPVTINKAVPGLVATFDCMLAHKFSKYAAKVQYPVLVEPKLDGVRVLTFVDPNANTVSFYSRTGKEFTTFEHLKKPVLAMAHAARKTLGAGPYRDDHDAALAQILLRSFVLDAEVVSGSFNKTVSEVRKKDVQATDAKLCVFDLLPGAIFESDDKSPMTDPFKDRSECLARLIDHTTASDPIVRVPAIQAHTEEEVYAFNERAMARGLEGAIVKDPNAKYARRRSQGWLKIKAEDSVDLQVIGYYYGEAGKQFENTLGGLVVNFNGVHVDVGGGYSVHRDGKSRDEFIEAVRRDVEALALAGQGVIIQDDGKSLVESATGAAAMGLEVLGRMIEVEYHEVTEDGSLRHPRYKRFRDDKPLVEEVEEVEGLSV